MKLETKLLRAVRQKIAQLLAVNLYELPDDRFVAGRIRSEVSDARAGVIRLDLGELLGHDLTGAERRAAHRAIDKLEAAGTLQRLLSDSRATHLALLEADPATVPNTDNTAPG